MASKTWKPPPGRANFQKIRTFDLGIDKYTKQAYNVITVKERRKENG